MSQTWVVQRILGYTATNLRIISLQVRSLFSQSLTLDGGAPPISSCNYSDIFE